MGQLIDFDQDFCVLCRSTVTKDMLIWCMTCHRHICTDCATEHGPGQWVCVDCAVLEPFPQRR